MLLVAGAGLPVLSLIAAALGAAATGTNGLMARMLPAALWDTGLLLVLVGLGTAAVGLAAAYLVSAFDFPGRRLFDWLFVLPLAVPTYLSAYAWVEFADYTGPLQQALRGLTGAESIKDYWFPNIRTTPGAAFVMVLVLYPYVYLSVRAFFLTQSGAVAGAARLLGASAWRSFFRIVLPLARPALLVGVTLALMEVLNDLGAVQYFGVNSLTAVIYASWINRGSFGGAAQLAVSLVLIVGLLLYAEQEARRRRASLGGRDSHTPPQREPLKGAGAALAVVFSLLVVGLGFGVPVYEFSRFAIGQLVAGSLPRGFGTAFGHTFLFAGLGALICLVLGYYSSWRAQSGTGRIGAGLLRVSTLGYAVPGTILALGLVMPLGIADRWLNGMAGALFGLRPGLVLSGSLVAVVYAYSVRFLAVSHSSLETARKRRGTAVLDAARVLGASRSRLILGVDLPTLSPALIGAATLVLVEGVKELPATLVLRPLGVETLATLVYAQASAGLFEAAALPALAIVLAGLVPVIAANHLSGRHSRRAH